MENIHFRVAINTFSLVLNTVLWCAQCLQILAGASSARSRKFASWTRLGSRPVAVASSAASSFRRFAEATVKLIRTSAASGRKLADPDCPSGKSTPVPAVLVSILKLFFFLCSLSLSLSFSFVFRAPPSLLFFRRIFIERSE